MVRPVNPAAEAIEKKQKPQEKDKKASRLPNVSFSGVYGVLLKGAGARLCKPPALSMNMNANLESELQGPTLNSSTKGSFSYIV